MLKKMPHKTPSVNVAHRDPVTRDAVTRDAYACAQSKVAKAPQLSAALAGLFMLLAAIALGLSAVPYAHSGEGAEQRGRGVEGLWSTGGSLVEVSATGDSLQMIVVALEEPFDVNGDPLVDTQNPEEAMRTQPILGMDLLAGYSHNGKRWQGKIYDPESGKTYSSHMKVKGDILEMRGYIGTPLLGKTKKFKPISQCRVDMLVMLTNADITGYCGL